MKVSELALMFNKLIEQNLGDLEVFIHSQIGFFETVSCEIGLEDGETLFPKDSNESNEFCKECVIIFTPELEDDSEDDSEDDEELEEAEEPEEENLLNKLLGFKQYGKT